VTRVNIVESIVYTEVTWVNIVESIVYTGNKEETLLLVLNIEEKIFRDEVVCIEEIFDDEAVKTMAM
jgi:hypothetical protein